MVSREVVNPVKVLKKSVGALDGEAAARLISAASDIALVVDKDGVVRDVSVGADDLSHENVDTWIGKSFIDTVTIESRIKVEELLRDAGTKNGSRWRQINHPSINGSGDLPIRYAAFQIGDRGRTVFIGRDLRAMTTLQQRLVNAQQSMEREYARLRQTETRYRLLFQMANEAVLVVDAASEKITEANPAAAAAFNTASKKIVGQQFLELFDASSAAALQGLLTSIRTTGRGEDVKVRLDGHKNEYLISASLFRQENANHYLVRLAPISGAQVQRVSNSRSKLIDVIEQLPDGFVVTGLDKRILTVNPAFLELAQLASDEQARGESLDRWLGRSSVDMNVLLSNLREYGVVRNFASVVRGELGTTEDVEISAVSVPNGEQPCLGFTIRSISRRINHVIRDTELPRSVQQLTELVGRVPMRDLVRDTTDMIERLCIEAALELAGDNRASAAEMLGLSRQSLYVKLRRYGLGDLGSEEEH